MTESICYFRRPHPSRERPPPARGGRGFAARVAKATRGTMSLVAWPFDAARAAYACAVGVGWLPRSMLANRDFEAVLGRVERVALGPWARRV